MPTSSRTRVLEYLAIFGQPHELVLTNRNRIFDSVLFGLNFYRPEYEIVYFTLLGTRDSSARADLARTGQCGVLFLSTSLLNIFMLCGSSESCNSIGYSIAIAFEVEW